MAHEAPVRVVVREGDAAVRAGDDVPAALAGHIGVVPAPVHEKDGLAALVEVLLQFRQQIAADGRLVPRGPLFAQVDGDDLRQCRFAVPGPQRVEAVAAGLRGGKGAEARRGGGQNEERAPFMTAELRDVPRVVPGAPVGLVRVFLFLVHDDETEVFDRREHRGTGADDDLREPFPDPFPLVEAFPGGQPAVEDRDRIAVALVKEVEGLGRQGDLRHHDDDALPRREHLIDEPQVHGCLAAAGDAVKERHASPVLPLRGEPVKGRLLLLLEHDGLRVALRPDVIGTAIHFLLIVLDDIFREQSLEDRFRDTGEVAQFLDGTGADAEEFFGDGPLLFCQLLRQGVEVLFAADEVGQADHADRGVSDSADRVIVPLQDALLREVLEDLRIEVQSEVGQDDLFPDVSGPVRKVIDDGLHIALEFGAVPVQVCDRERGHGREVDTRREHRPKGIKKSTKGAFPHVLCQCDHVSIDQRCLVQHRRDRFVSVQRESGAQDGFFGREQTDDDSLTEHGAAPKGHHDTAAHLKVGRERLRHEVPEQAVKMVCRVLYRDFRNESHVLHRSSFWNIVGSYRSRISRGSSMMYSPSSSFSSAMETGFSVRISPSMLASSEISRASLAVAETSE